MDHGELFSCCRRGDLDRIKYLVEQKEIEVNIRDKWDSTPLYYACLCGHYDVVQYLLENGAQCEANTFDGERCLYGALNIQIRNLLTNFKVITSKTLRRDNYDTFLRQGSSVIAKKYVIFGIFKSIYLCGKKSCFETGDYHDVSFVVHGQYFPAHRCILLARCEYFKVMFLGRWMHRELIHITNPLVTMAAFKAVLQYLYTGRLDIHFDNLEDCIILAKQCGLFNLINELQDTVRKVAIFENAKPGTRITTLSVESYSLLSELQQDFGILAKQTLPSELHTWVGGNELPFLPSLMQLSFTDICVNVKGHNFLCHKIFICGRSDYFKALLADHFFETTEELFEETSIQQITLHDISYEIFLQILYYIYQNTAELCPSVVLDVLRAADMYLLPGLKKQCALVIGQHLDIGNVVNILKLARMYNLPRLEDQCAEFIAKYLDQISSNEDFHKIIVSDAQEVHHRQETDSISIIDDIRYHITSNIQTFSEMEDATEKLTIIDKLLEKLELDA